MRAPLLLFVLGAAAATASNLLCYREALTLAERARSTVEAGAQAHGPIDSICLAELPEYSHGLLFFGDQVLEQIRFGLRGRSIAVRLAGPACCGSANRTLAYRWNPSTRSLQLIGRAPQ
jgi:hypothetical protein